MAVVVFAPLLQPLFPLPLSRAAKREKREEETEGESKREKHISSSPVESNHAKPQIRRDPPETIARDRACVPACERAVLTVSCGQGHAVPQPAGTQPRDYIGVLVELHHNGDRDSRGLRRCFLVCRLHL